MRLHTAGMLVLGVGLCGLAGTGVKAAEADRLPAFASRNFFETLSRSDAPPGEDGADARVPQPGSEATTAAAPGDDAPRQVADATPAPPATASAKPLPHLPPPTAPREAPQSWPKTLPEAKAESAAKVDLAAYWTEGDIGLARARCTAILKSLDAVTVPEPPMRQGACGAPAPVRLISIGKKPEVALTPPPLVTCDMVQALHAWITKDVQPLAKRRLGTQIVSMELMSDYSCRNAYGSRNGRLSEHARANALDIRGFLTAKGEMTAFLEDWGLTGREIRDIAARDKAEAVKLAAQKPAAAQTRAADATGGTKAAAAASGSASGAAETLSPAVGISRATLAEGLARIPSVPMTPKGVPAVGFAASHLGGPKPAETKAPPKPAASSAAPGTMAAAAPAASGNIEARAAFLREAHAAACRIFGTVLGPEANRAHRNHLHVDMADRTSGVFCE